jgi:hypothetical protein
MDKRTNNGNKGHSTKAKGVDKRKNQYLHLLDEASTDEDVISVIKKLKLCALNGDVQAIKLFLEYYLGKPKETIETTHNINNFDIKKLINFED